MSYSMTMATDKATGKVVQAAANRVWDARHAMVCHMDHRSELDQLDMPGRLAHQADWCDAMAALAEQYARGLRAYRALL
jgi:hypothetical protein